MTTETRQTTEANKNEISLRELVMKLRQSWKYLLSKWLIIVFFGFLGGILGFLYARYKKPVYTATTTFVLEDEKGGGGLGGLAGLASIAGVDLGGGAGGIFQGDNILGLYKSRTMLEQTLLTPITEAGKTHLLVDKYIDFNKLRGKWSKTPALDELRFDTLKPTLGFGENRLRDSILGEIVVDLNKNYLTVSKPDRKMSTIQVDVRSEDESFAKNFNDQLVKNVNEFYVSTKTKKTLQNYKIIKRKTDSVRSIMNGAIYTAVAIVDATPNLNPTRQVQRVAPAQRAQFSAETNKAVLAELVKNQELTQMSLMKETPLIQLIDEPIFPLKKDEVGKFKMVVVGIFFMSILAVVVLLLKRQSEIIFRP